MRVNITLACTECKRKNYVSVKNKKNTTERIELKKYCPWEKLERRSPKPQVGGSNPSCPAIFFTFEY